MKLGTPLDANQQELKSAVTHKLAAPPSTPVAGQRYYDTTMKAERIYDGATWVTVADITYVNPSAPAGTPNSGDLWWDSDDAAPGITTPLGVTDGGTGATSPSTARASLAVPGIGNSASVAGAPTAGTWARGDQWLDSAGVVWTCVTAGTPGVWTAPPGTELAYNQITASVNVTATSPAVANVVIEGTSRTYDGTPIIVEFYSFLVQAPNAAQNGTYISLWDAGTDIGYLNDTFPGSATSLGSAVFARRRLTPTAGTHNYRIGGWYQGGASPIVYAGPGGAATFPPAYVRVIRA